MRTAPSLEFLPLNNNQLTRLPAGIFSGLSALSTLSLHNNLLTTLPEGIFSDTNNLSNLRVDPLAPTSLAAAPHSSAEINLIWTAPPVSRNSSIVGYRIQTASSADGEFTDATANTQSATTRYVVAGLSPATTYFYRIAAVIAPASASADIIGP